MSPRILTRTKRVPGVLAESDKWRTPPDLFAALHAEFSFMIDLAADETNRLCEFWLGPGSELSENALATDWRQVTQDQWGGYPHLWGFCNPPYSSELIAQFVEGFVVQTRDGCGFNVAALLPDTHDTRWYRHLRWASEIRRIPHRVPYLKADGTTKAGAMFPSCVAIFRPQPGVRNPAPRIVEWTWRTE